MSLLLALCGEVAVGLFFCCDDDNFSLYFAASSNAEQCLFFFIVATKTKMFLEMCVTLITLLVRPHRCFWFCFLFCESTYLLCLA